MTTPEQPNYSELTVEQLEALLEAKKGKAKIYRSSYTRKNAMMFKSAYDSCIENGKSVIIKYDDFPRQSCRTLYNKVCDGLLWLMENLPDDEADKYRKLRQTVRFSMMPDTVADSGILIMTNQQIVKPRTSAPIAKVSADQSWRAEFQTWLEVAPPSAIFSREGLSLSEEDVNTMRNTCAELELTFNITTQSIKVMK